MKLVLPIVLFFIGFSCLAQENNALVFLIDKANVDMYLANPLSMLTQEAIDRKNTHATLIDVRDVPVNEEYISTIKNNEGVVVLAKSKWMNSVFVRGSQTDIKNLLTLDFVSVIEFADNTLNLNTVPAERAPKFNISDQNRINYNYGNAVNQTEMIAVNRLHQQDFTGDGMRIALMDSGFPNIAKNPAFSALNVENRLLGSYDFVNRQENVEGTGTHGSETLSCMAGYLPDVFVGTAPQASYYLFRTEFAPTENPVEEAWWVEALERADSLGVDVVNTSLGYRNFDNAAYNHSYEDLDGNTSIAARGANLAFQKGMLLVTSAGNGGQTDFKTVGTPADSPNVISIGAVDFNGDYAVFSSIGPTVEGRIKPDVVAQGQAAAVVDTTGQIDFVNGTSFSSPIIAGAVTCLWQALPTLNNAEIMQLVRKSGSLYQNPTDEMGYGIPNFESALSDGLFLGLQSQLLQKQFKLQANPVDTEVNISFPEGISTATLQFFNLLGQRLMNVELTSSDHDADVSHLPEGLYIAVISGGGTTNSFKVIKK